MERYQRFNTAVAFANAIFWTWFWWYFLSYGTTTGPEPIWEGASSWARAFGRGFGDGMSMTETLRIPIVRIAAWLFMPCFVVTWPIAQWAPVGFDFAGFDAQGLRLTVITALSFVQWHLLVMLLFHFRSCIRNRDSVPM